MHKHIRLAMCVCVLVCFSVRKVGTCPGWILCPRQPLTCASDIGKGLGQGWLLYYRVRQLCFEAHGHFSCINWGYVLFSIRDCMQHGLERERAKMSGEFRRIPALTADSRWRREKELFLPL